MKVENENCEVQEIEENRNEILGVLAETNGAKMSIILFSPFSLLSENLSMLELFKLYYLS